MTEPALPQSWTTVPLGAVGEWRGGGTPTKNNPSYWNGDIPWASPKDMKVGRLRNTADAITRAALEESATTLIPENSVAFVTRSGILAHTFPVATTEIALAINQDLKAITPYAGIDHEYLAWALRAAQHSILSKCSKDGTTVHSIEMPALYAFEIPLAPYHEQRRIVAKIEELFSELDNGIEGLKLASRRLRTYRLAALDAATTGQLLVKRGVRDAPFAAAETTTLASVVESLDQGWSPRCLNHPSPSDDIWCVMKTTAVQPGEFREEENKELPVSLEPRPHLALRKGDVLVTRAGPRNRVGVACLVRSSRPRLMLCDKAYRLRPNCERILPAFLEIVLNAPRTVDRIEALKTGISDSGVNLTQQRFLSLDIYVPSIAEQEVTIAEIESVLSNVSHTQTQVDDTLARESPLRQAILERAFEGRLVDQHPEDEPAAALLKRIAGENGQAEQQNGARRAGRRRKTGA